MTPLKEKYAVVTMNLNKSIMSSTVRRVLVWSFVSPSNSSRINCRARFMGVLVKSDTTSWEINIHVSWWFLSHVLHRAVNNQDVIKMSDGHRNVVVRYHTSLLQLCKVRSFYIIDCTNWIFSTLSYLRFHQHQKNYSVCKPQRLA